jgi:MFS-type transporter involved in bile tolerance (Atg22 family)
VLFGFSAVMGAISLKFLKRIPDVTPPAAEAVSRTPVPWREISRYGPFRKLLRLNVAWALAYGGVNTFTVAYLKAGPGWSEATILLLTGLAFLGGLSGLAYFESRTDRLGSRPVMMFCLAIWLGISAMWLLLAGRVLEARFGLVLVLELLMGFAYALVNMNNTRLAMLLVPPMGRSHFFALFSVVASVALGVSPVLWGLLIDAVGAGTSQWGVLEVNRYSLFFGSVLGVFAVCLVLCRRLDEPKARDLEELITELLRSPQRLWLRLWPRG